ncbi:MAG TPA: bifunctional hydroxymethylpyrimidine kinase/phosphomethylpyrimidine kinase [Longimicrobiales bacterium]|nr:bifunctional hydroxymethylpyrimidine kinase/phosphomethylpyrimidine kinase [Longimicrobiales bacterium]
MDKQHGSTTALTIAGSDSGGGAGIQADLKTFHAFGVFGTSAITAITVQNTRGVSGVHPVPLDIVTAQITAVADDLPPAACKTGMLATRELVSAVAASIRSHRLPNYVLDPVMVATSGDRLLEEDAQNAVLDELVPLCALVTPNLDEAAILAGFAVKTVDDMHRAARRLIAAGARAALVKGGHLRSDELVDVLYDGTSGREFRWPRIATRNTHGTGCTLSAAITALLARGASLDTAVEQALDFVHRAIAQAPNLGAGSGPLNHFVPVHSERQ